MKVTVYLFHNLVGPHELNAKRCEKCNRVLFKYSAENMVVANSGPSKFDVYQPGSKYIEVRCHSCGTDHSVLFQ